VGSNEGWKRLQIPTQLEKETDKIDSPKGLVLVCLAGSKSLHERIQRWIDPSWRIEETASGHLSSVNGRAMMGLAWKDSYLALNRPQGHYWEMGGDEYETETRVGDGRRH
jgi:hypothetical protein